MLTHRNGASSRKNKKDDAPFQCIIFFVYSLILSYLFLAKNCCMSARHSSSSTPDVTIVLGCSAWGAYLV